MLFDLKPRGDGRDRIASVIHPSEDIRSDSSLLDDGCTEGAAWINQDGLGRPHRKPPLSQAVHVEIELTQIRGQGLLHGYLSIPRDLNQALVALLLPEHEVDPRRVYKPTLQGKGMLIGTQQPCSGRRGLSDFRPRHASLEAPLDEQELYQIEERQGRNVGRLRVDREDGRFVILAPALIADCPSPDGPRLLAQESAYFRYPPASG